MLEILTMLVGFSGGYFVAEMNNEKNAMLEYQAKQIKDLEANKNIIKVGNKTVYTLKESNNPFISKKDEKAFKYMCLIIEDDLEQAKQAVKKECDSIN